MIKIIIGLCAVLAVIMIVIGGLEYMTSELTESKAHGKESIKNAILGLLLALGALTHSTADVALSVTGIAGPDGGSADKPVGTVCFAWCRRNGMPQTASHYFAGDRTSVRHQAVAFALEGLLGHLNLA